MAETAVLKIIKREGRGTRKAGKLRKTGQAPGVIYGHKQETVSVAVASHDLVAAIRHGARVVDLQLDGATEKAQIMEVQWDHLGQDVLHVDFRRVSADERIHLTVPIELRGIAPGVSGGGGVLDQPLHALEIECPAVHVPESIRVNINELQLGAAIHVRDLTLPPDVKALADPDAIVVHVTAPQAEEEPGAEPTPGAAEPEIVGRRVAAEEPEEK